jgi:hypothetical protein
MQFGHTLHRILRKIHFANPADGPVYLHRDGEEPISCFPARSTHGLDGKPAVLYCLKSGEDPLPHRLDAAADPHAACFLRR